MKRGLLLIAVILAALYPFLIYFGLKHLSLQFTAALLLVLLGIRLAVLSVDQRKKILPLFVLLLLNFLGALVLDQALFVLLSPVVISLSLFAVFCSSLLAPVSMVERFARIMDPDLPEEGVTYCREVTKVWCAFFLVNSLVSTWTVFFESIDVWVLYNGFIAYIAIGVLFLVEYLVRSIVMGRNESA